MSHVLIKLSNRDDIVGILESENDNKIIIKDPMILVIKHDQESDESGALLISYNPFSSTDYVTFNSENVISIIPLNDEMIKYYFLSKLYCQRTFDKNFRANLLRSTEYLENYLNSTRKPKKKPDIKEDVINFFMSQAASNTVN